MIVQKTKLILFGNLPECYSEFISKQSMIEGYTLRRGRLYMFFVKRGRVFEGPCIISTVRVHPYFAIFLHFSFSYQHFTKAECYRQSITYFKTKKIVFVICVRKIIEISVRRCICVVHFLAGRNRTFATALVNI